MSIKIISFYILSLLILTSCSSSYNEIKKTDNITPSNFQEYLYIEYKNRAIFEAEEMHDWNSAKLYSEKALRSLKSDLIYPEKNSNWKISLNKINEIKVAHTNLLSIYNEAKIIDPKNLAIAISSLDCWSEQQEENWQTWDIINCKESFINSMHNIYKKISNKKINNNKISKDNAIVVTKNKKNELKHIIYFDFDDSELSLLSLNKIDNFLQKYGEEIKEFLLVGHADTKGSDKYNLNLSYK